MTFTPRGIFFLLASLLLVGGGFAMTHGPLIALGLAGFIVLVMVAILGRWNLARLNLYLTGPSRAFANKTFDARLTVVNSRALFDACALDLEVKLSGSEAAHAHAPWTAARSSSTAKLRLTAIERGSQEEHPFEISSRFPLGLFFFDRKGRLHHPLEVFPKSLVPKEFFAQGQFEDAWEGNGFEAGDAPGEPRGLRPYQPGDRAKQIHWPSTLRSLARGRHPRIREYDPPGLRPSKAAVIFHSFATDNTLIRTDQFERALSLVCGTLKHLRKHGIPTILRADFLEWRPQKTFDRESWSQTLTLLAIAQRANHTEAHDLVAEIEAIPPDQAILILSDMPPDSWQPILPARPLIIIDIRQHHFGHRSLSFATAAS